MPEREHEAIGLARAVPGKLYCTTTRWNHAGTPFVVLGLVGMLVHGHALGVAFGWWP